MNITPIGWKSKKRLKDGMERRRDVDIYQASCFEARNYIEHSVSAENVFLTERSPNFMLLINIFIMSARREKVRVYLKS